MQFVELGACMQRLHDTAQSWKSHNFIRGTVRYQPNREATTLLKNNILYDFFSAKYNAWLIIVKTQLSFYTILSPVFQLLSEIFIQNLRYAFFSWTLVLTVFLIACVTHTHIQRKYWIFLKERTQGETILIFYVRHLLPSSK